MCAICGRFPCDSRCPNAPDPPTVFTCAYCGEPIVPGDEYMELDGSYYRSGVAGEVRCQNRSCGGG